MRLFGVIGKPLKHSASPLIFNEKFRGEGLDCRYGRFELDDISQFKALLEDNTELCGLNVTSPFKVSVMGHLDEISEEALKIGAVNTVRIRRDTEGRVHTKGFNTDYFGFRNSLPALQPGTKAMVLGTGGASKAVIAVLRDNGLLVSNISRRLGEGIFKTYDMLTVEDVLSHGLIVNCTTLGMYPDTGTFPDIPYEGLTKYHLLYDLVYNPTVTEFLKMGHQYGASTIGGMDMLLSQAAESWKLFS